MKKAEVRVGGIYLAKVSGKLTHVRLVEEDPSKGWWARNIETGRRVRIRTAARLRREATPPVYALAEGMGR